MPTFQPASSRVGSRQSPGRMAMTMRPMIDAMNSRACSRAMRIGIGRHGFAGKGAFCAMAPLLAVAGCVGKGPDPSQIAMRMG